MGNLMGILNANIVQLSDEARSTIKENTILYDHLGNAMAVVSANSMYPTDEARSTIKQETLINNYISSGLQNINVRTREDAKNMETSDGREIISKLRAPTWKGIAQTPDKKLLNVELKDTNSIQLVNCPDKSKFNQNRVNFIFENKKEEQEQTQNIISNDELLNILNNSLKDNALVNNIVHKPNNNAKIIRI